MLFPVQAIRSQPTQQTIAFQEFFVKKFSISELSASQQDQSKYDSPTSTASVFFTPTGECITEINECYYSIESISDKAVKSDDLDHRTPLRSGSLKKNLRRRSLNNTLQNRINDLSKLSISERDRISIESSSSGENSKMATSSKGDFRKKQVASPSVTVLSPVAGSTAFGTRDVNLEKSLFNVARIKKVELQDLSPKVTDRNGKALVTHPHVPIHTNPIGFNSFRLFFPLLSILTTVSNIRAISSQSQ